jgi:hypothetical protein
VGRHLRGSGEARAKGPDGLCLLPTSRFVAPSLVSLSCRDGRCRWDVDCRSLLLSTYTHGFSGEAADIPDRPLEASEPLHPPRLPHYSPSPHCSPLPLLPPVLPRLCLFSPPLPPPAPSTADAPHFYLPPARPPVPADPAAPAPHSLPSAPPQPTARPPGRPCQLFSCLHSSRLNPTLRPWLPWRPCTARSNTRFPLQRPCAPPLPPPPPSPPPQFRLGLPPQRLSARPIHPHPPCPQAMASSRPISQSRRMCGRGKGSHRLCHPPAASLYDPHHPPPPLPLPPCRYCVLLLCGGGAMKCWCSEVVQ